MKTTDWIEASTCRQAKTFNVGSSKKATEIMNRTNI